MMNPNNLTLDIYNYIKKEMNHSKDFDLEANIIEEGLVDSTGILALILFLEERFGIEIDLEDINPENFARVGAIADFVNKLVR
jgi:acyl carrier protein